MSFKKILFPVVTLVVLILIVTACGGGGSTGIDEGSSEQTSTSPSTSEPAAAEVFEIDVNNVFAATHHQAVNVWIPWAEIVKEKTDGRIKINIHHGGVLGSVENQYDDLNGGVYDMVVGVPKYFFDTDLFKLSLIELPFAFNNVRDAANVITKYMEKQGEGVWGEHITPSKIGSASDPFALFSKKEIRSVEDMKGLKIGIATDSWNAVFEKWGATPVFIPGPEQYEALDRGMIDATMYSPSGAVGLALYEPAPYIVKIGLNTTNLGPVIRTEVLEEMPEDVRNLFENELIPELSELFIKNYEQIESSSWEQLESEVKGRGEIINLAPDIEQQFRASGKIAWDEWVSTANKRGYDGEQLMEDFLQTYEELGLQPPF